MRPMLARKALPALTTAALLIAIFCFSSQSGPESNALSGGMAETLMEYLPGESSGGAFKLLNYLLRRAAHATLYCCLGVSLYELVRADRRRDIPLTLSLGLTAAALDELHQYFVPGRSAKITDVLLDLCGVAAGCLLAAAIAGRARKNKAGRVSRREEVERADTEH